MYACHFDVGDAYHDRRYKCGAVESDNPSSQCTTPVAVWSAGEKVSLLPTGSEERKVLGVGSIPVATLPSCQIMNIIALQLHNINIVG